MKILIKWLFDYLVFFFLTQEYLLFRLQSQPNTGPGCLYFFTRVPSICRTTLRKQSNKVNWTLTLVFGCCPTSDYLKLGLGRAEFVLITSHIPTASSRAGLVAQSVEQRVILSEGRGFKSLVRVFLCPCVDPIPILGLIPDGIIGY